MKTVIAFYLIITSLASTASVESEISHKVNSFLTDLNQHSSTEDLSFVKVSHLHPSYIIVASEYCMDGKSEQNCGYVFDAINISGFEEGMSAHTYFQDTYHLHFYDIANTSYASCDQKKMGFMSVPLGIDLKQSDVFRDCTTETTF